MRFRSTLEKEPKHTELVSCVGWNNTDEVYSCGDDHALMKWNLVSNENVKVADLPSDLYPTDLHWFPRVAVAGKKQGPDVLLITAADGKFHMVNKNGRLEKSVEAHTGAVLCGRWSHDGASILTAGEDGQVKVWSRSGMLRSTVLQSDAPVYCAVWGPGSSQVLHTLGKMLVVKPLAPSAKASKWKAHDGLILKVAWSENNNLIISGGEDCRYKVWDTYGRLLFGSTQHDYPITSLAWSPDGDLFAAGSYNTLRLCDKTGWSYSLDKPNTGSVFNLAWSSDATQVAGACGNGHVLFAHVVGRCLEWHNYMVTVTEPKIVQIWDVVNDSQEKLQFSERVIKVALGHGHLVVVTPTQCQIFNTLNWNTPAMFELRDGSICLLLLSERHFLLAEKSALSVYSYEGRLLSSPRWPNMQPDMLTSSLISLSPDTLAVRDQTDDKMVRVFELGVGRAAVEAEPLHHKMAVVEVALNQVGTAVDRQLALLDQNRDLYLAMLRGAGSRRLCKLGSMILAVCWNSSTSVLSAVQDTNIVLWYFPSILFIDKRLLQKTTLKQDSSEFGKSPTINSFLGNHLSVRRADGSLVNLYVASHFTVLQQVAAKSQWAEAVTLCRQTKNSAMWACLAGMAVRARQLDTAEEAYAAVDEFDKVLYIQHINETPVRALKLAQTALLTGNFHEADNTLLQNGLVFRAIWISIQTHNWNRALELATKHKTHVDTVLLYRKKILDALDKTETNEKFLQFKDEVELDPEKIESKIKLEFQKERDEL